MNVECQNENVHSHLQSTFMMEVAIRMDLVLSAYELQKPVENKRDS
jgi:hypothetical protein